MILRALFSTLLALTVAPTSADPLRGLPERPIDIELRGAPIQDVFMLIEDIAEVDIALAPCVGGTVDLQLERVTLRTLMEALATALALEYRQGEQGAIVVGCASGEASTASLTVELHDATVAEIVDAVMPEADVIGCDGRRMDLEVRNASPAAIMSSVAGELSAALELQGSRLQLRCD